MQTNNLPRENFNSFSSQKWAEYIEILRTAKTYPSGYKVVYESGGGINNREIFNITLYDLFVWLHHFAAKDNDGAPIGKDIYVGV